MPNRLETYRVEAYNTAKQSENKMHDDTVARRFGFSGGLVPGVDVFAYMMHVPVARWGRDFLSRGLVEARFIKPVYDGETADVDATEHNGLLTIEVFSRTELCATGTASLPAAAPVVSLNDFVEVAAIAERKPVSPAAFEVGNWLGTGFDADTEMLGLINSGKLSDSPVGRYLLELKQKFEGPVVADLVCYLRLHTELARVETQIDNLSRTREILAGLVEQYRVP